MFVVLPAIAFIFLFLFFRKTNCWQSAVLASAIVWGTLSTAIVEILSILKLLEFGWVLGAWSLSSLGFWALYLYPLSTSKKRQAIYQSDSIKQKTNSNKRPFKLLLLGVFFIVAVVSVVALVAPPNTMDSMHYHMPRVVHWMQNHSVAHYPTHFTPQLFLAPWAEFAILHLQILSGSDHYANLVQWFSMVGSIIGTSLIAKQLGANRYGQIFAAVFCATLPMGIVQASGTQNDYVVAFWLVCLIYYILLTIQSNTKDSHFLEIGVSLGLAMLTKPTAYLYAFPFLVWLFVSSARILHWQTWKPLCQLATLALSINIFHYLRNFELFHTPLGSPPANITYTNRIFDIPHFLSSVIRNISLHFSTPVPSINRLLIKGLSLIHTALNVDISDPRTSSSVFQLNSLINQEDFAGNPIHLLLIIILISVFGLAWRKKDSYSSYLLGYVLSTVTGFILFCLILAWTPFNTRLHLPLFVLLSAFAGCIVSKYLKEKLVIAIATLLITFSFPWVFFNETRPAIANSKFISTHEVKNIFNTARTDQYFITQPDLKDPFIGAAQFIKSQKCSSIGLALHSNTFEYPLWILLQDKNTAYQLENVDVKNISAEKFKEFPYKDFRPCAIFENVSNSAEKKSSWESDFTRKWFLYPISIMMKK